MTFNTVDNQVTHAKLNLFLLLKKIQYALDHHHHVDLIMLDIYKAFDTVGHNRLLNKLKFYGIEGKIADWLSIWVTQRSQCVVLDGFYPIRPLQVKP